MSRRQGSRKFKLSLVAIVTGLLTIASGFGSASTSTAVAAGNYSLFSEQEAVGAEISPETGDFELGLRFKASTPGTATAVKFYKAPGDVSSRKVTIWSDQGKKIASFQSSGETASGWQTLPLSVPLTLSANKTYTVSYHASRFMQTPKFFHSSRKSGPFFIGATQNGVKRSGEGMPVVSIGRINYWVDVVFNIRGRTRKTPTTTTSMAVPSTTDPVSTTTSTVAPTTSTTITGGNPLALPHVPWEGGPTYWSQFSKAASTGWNDPSYFPISVFLGKADPTHVASLKDAGVNLYMGVEHDNVNTITNITNAGLYAMPQQDEWTLNEVGNNNRAVAWFISDECDMGLGGCPGEQNAALAQNTTWVNKVRAYNDGRFVHANFGNGILRTYWATNTMSQQVQLMSSASADKYTYTSPGVWDIIDGSHDAPDWPNGVPINRAYSYGWQADQMKRFQNPADPRPIWTFVETARPYLNEAGALTIQPEQIEGAVWSAIIHEARGIAYFQHNNDGTCGNYSIVDCPVVHAKVKAINASVRALAPVINTQSYYNNTRVMNGFTYYNYTFNNGTDTMLKTYNGSAYIFAGIGMQQSTGIKTFIVPTGVHGTLVEVVGEGRTLPVSGGAFTDNFANEYTHHTYRITL